MGEEKVDKGKLAGGQRIANDIEREGKVVFDQGLETVETPVVTPTVSSTVSSTVSHACCPVRRMVIVPLGNN